MRLIAPLVLGSLLLGTTAHAAIPHQGFMFRAGLGFGFDLAGDSDGDTSVSISGLSGALNVSLGGYVAPNLAINGDVWFSATPDPQVEVESGNVTASGEADGTMSFLAVGAGVTYWIGDIDLFLTGTLGAGRMTLEDNQTNDTFDTDWGIAGKLGVGKQWAMGVGGWGLGVSGDLTIAKLEDEDSAESALFVATHVYFTVSYH